MDKTHTIQSYKLSRKLNMKLPFCHIKVLGPVDVCVTDSPKLKFVHVPAFSNGTYIVPIQGLLL